MAKLPKYPIYIPSKGRYDKCLTANFLKKDGVPFKLVVEEAESYHYMAKYGKKNVLVLPFSDKGSVIPSRNWIKEYSTKKGHKRHWQLDDNMTDVYRMYKRKRIKCNAGVAFACIEDFTDRYENVAISGLNYTMFGGAAKLPPFHLNCHVYSCSLILNNIPHQWRGTYNEDTDICLQVLADDWCTLLINAFMIDKMRTMTMKGGNTSEIYQGDGRLKMARSLERMWPRVVSTKRRFERPQHVVYDRWTRFDTQLKLKKGIKINNNIDEYGMKLNQIAPIKSKRIKQIYKENIIANGEKKEAHRQTQKV